MCHLLGGLIIMLLAFQFYENRLFGLQNFYIVLGSLLIIIGIASKWIDKLIGKVSVLFFFVEAAAFFYAGKVKHDEEDAVVSLVINVSAIGYLVLAGYFLFIKKQQSTKKSIHRKHVAKS